MATIGFIDYYLDEWHATNYPAWIEKYGAGEFELRYAYGHVEPPEEMGRRSNDAYCEAFGLERVATIHELIEKSDVIVVLSPDNPEMHWKLSEEALRSGKPLYIDKTLSNSRQETELFYTLADASGTPFFSTSALRYSNAYRGVDLSRGSSSLESFGAGEPYNYSVHQLEPIVMLTGEGFARVRYLKRENDEAETYKFEAEQPSGRIIHVTQKPNLPFRIDFRGEDGTTYVLEAEDAFFERFIQEMLEFFKRALAGDGMPPFPREETLKIMAARELMLEAMERSGEWVET